MSTKLPSIGDCDLMKLGARLDDDGVRKLEARVQRDSGDRNARLALLAATRASMDVRASQALWFIEHEPATYLGPELNVVTSMNRGDEAKARWLAAIAAHPNEFEVVENAALFLLPEAPDLGGQQLETFLHRHLTGEFLARLFTYWYGASIFHRSRAELFANQALLVAFRSFRTDKDAHHTFPLIDRMADCARICRVETPLRALRAARTTRNRWAHEHARRRTQLGLVIRGFVAIAAGDSAWAEEELRKAISVNGFPTEPLANFIAELVSAGSSEVAIATLEVWKRRLEGGVETIDGWLDDIRAGRTPHVPSALADDHGDEPT